MFSRPNRRKLLELKIFLPPIVKTFPLISTSTHTHTHTVVRAGRCQSAKQDNTPLEEASKWIGAWNPVFARDQLCLLNKELNKKCVLWHTGIYRCGLCVWQRDIKVAQYWSPGTGINMKPLLLSICFSAARLPLKWVIMASKVMAEAGYAPACVCLLHSVHGVYTDQVQLRHMRVWDGVMVSMRPRTLTANGANLQQLLHFYMYATLFSSVQKYFIEPKGKFECC